MVQLVHSVAGSPGTPACPSQRSIDRHCLHVYAPQVTRPMDPPGPAADSNLLGKGECVWRGEGENGQGSAGCICELWSLHPL